MVQRHRLRHLEEVLINLPLYIIEKIEMIFVLIKRQGQTHLKSMSSLSSKMDSNVTKNVQPTVPGWKWEVNHDGVMLNWDIIYNMSSQKDIPTQSQKDIPTQSENKQNMKELSTKKSLVDYWYVVHDGVVIPGINDV